MVVHPKIVYLPKTVTYLRNNQDDRDSNQRRESRKSNVLTNFPELPRWSGDGDNRHGASATRRLNRNNVIKIDRKAVRTLYVSK